MFAIGEMRPGDAAAALIVVDGERYLMQRRSETAGIFYPGHWGLFGGAADAGEDLVSALRRELHEELTLEVDAASYFTEFTFDFSYLGLGRIVRRFYEVLLTSATVAEFVQHEGDEMGLFTAREILTEPRVVPYDAFAIWLHATRPGR